MNGSNNRYHRFKDFLEDNVNTIVFLLILTVIVSVITYYRILVQIDMGPVSDSFDFLSNALVFAGQGTGYSDLTRPPFFSFIISIFFRFGFVSVITIFALDGALFVFGVIGMFFFLKLIFKDLESFLGALLFSTFPVILTILGFGFSDLVSVTFTIWALYFMVRAVKTNSKFFYLAFPFAMLAFLTRYNSGLIIFPIFIYILMNRHKLNFKDLIIGILTSILIIVPVFIYYMEKFGDALYPFINSGTTSTGISSSIMHIAYNTNFLFYIQKFPEFVGIQGFMVLLILILGVLFVIIFRSRYKIKNNNGLLNDLNLKSRLTKIKLILFILMVIIFYVSFIKVTYIVNEFLFFILIYLFFDLTKNVKIKSMDLHIMVFTWFMVFFIFHSIFVIKNNRYFVPMIPPLVYFMILGLSEVSKRINLKIRNKNVTFPLIAMLLTLLILLSTASAISQISHSNNDIKSLNNEIKQSSTWFISNYPDYKNKNIYSDLWPNYSWYLKTNVKMVPIYQAYQILPDGTKVYTVNQADNNAFNKYLLNNNADYFFSEIPGLNLTSYKPINQFGNIIIYQKIV